MRDFSIECCAFNQLTKAKLSIISAILGHFQIRNQSFQEKSLVYFSTHHFLKININFGLRKFTIIIGHKNEFDSINKHGAKTERKSHMIEYHAQFFILLIFNIFGAHDEEKDGGEHLQKLKFESLGQVQRLEYLRC